MVLFQNKASIISAFVLFLIVILYKNEAKGQCENITYSCVAPTSATSNNGSVTFNYSGVPGAVSKTIWARSNCNATWVLVQPSTTANPVTITGLDDCDYEFSHSVYNSSGGIICYQYSYINLILPQAVAISSNSPICAGERLILNGFVPSMANTPTYSWSGPGGFTATGSSVSRTGFTAAMAGTYTVTISTGCSSSTQTINVALDNSCPTTCRSDDYIYLNDYSNNITHKFEINPNGSVVEVGSPWLPYNGTQIDVPHGVSMDANGNIYIAEYTEGNYVKLNCDGVITNTQAEAGSGFNHEIIGNYMYITTGASISVYDLCDAVKTRVGYVVLEPYVGGISSWGLTYNPNDGYLYATDNYEPGGFVNPNGGDIYRIDPRNPTSATSVFQLHTDLTPVYSGFQILFGIAFDMNNNMYVVEQTTIGGTTNIRKLTTSNGTTWTLAATITDAIEEQVGYYDGWGITYSKSANMLYVSSFKEDCLAKISPTTFSYVGAAVPHVPGTSAKALDIVEEGCYRGPSTITTTICPNTSILLRGLLNCDVCGGVWTRTSGTGGVYNSCSQTFTATGATTPTTFTFTGNNAQCGPYSVTINLTVQNITLASVVTPVCTGGASTGAIDLSIASGGVAPFTYDWADLPGILNPEDRTGLAPGTYTVTVTDNIGCTTSTAISIINTVTASVIAGNQTVCSGGDPSAFTVTTAASGAGTLSYQWQSSTTGCAGTFTNIAGANSATYDPPIGLLSTTSYRVVVTSTWTGVACSATSNCIVVTVNSVTASTIAGNQDICSGGDPNAFTVTTAATGSGVLTYQWQQSTTGCGGTFTNISGATAATYNPPAGVLVSTNYRVVVTSTLSGLACTATSNCITVNINSVTASTITGTQTICSGGDPAAFGVSTVATGSGTLTYQWQSSTTGCAGTFTNIAGATASTYDPPTGLSVATSYRVIVTSTLGGLPCTATSNCITVSVNAVTPSTIAGNQTICGGGDPAAFTVTTAATGTGTLTYQWQSNTTGCAGVFNNITGAVSATNDPPSGIAATTYYRVMATSTLNGVACSAFSNCLTVTANTVTPGTISGDQVICSLGNPAAFTVSTPASGAGTLSYQWQSSTTGCAGTFTNIAGANAATYDPPSGLASTTSYRLVVTSTLGGIPCTATTNCVTVSINIVSAGAIATDQALCTSGDPAAFTVTTAATGSGLLSYQWQSSTTGCGGTFSDISGATGATYDPPAGLSATTNYKRIATSTLSGQACSATSNCVTVTLINLTPSVIAGDQTICFYMDPAAFTVTTPASSSGTLTYQWQSSTTGCSGTFTNIAGATSSTYDPPTGLTATTNYHVVITATSGSQTCTATSNCVTIYLNTVTASVITGDQAVCPGGDPIAFTATTPATGAGTLAYFWQSSTGGCSSTFNNISGATSATYDLTTAPSTTTYYKVVVLSTLNGVGCADVSNCVTVSPNTVTASVIAGNQTLCAGDDPAAFTVATAATGAGTLSYQWERSTTGCSGSFTDIAGATSAVYDPPSGLSATTNYRVRVTSTLLGSPCTAYSNCLTVTINNVTAGAISGDQTICLGGNSSAFSLPTPASGSGALTYQWQQNTVGCSGTFTNISGATASTYDPPIGLTSTTYYRLITTSTLNGLACTATSNCSSIIVNSVTASTIAGNQTICSGGNPAAFTSPVAATAAGTLFYQWQSSIVDCNSAFSNISGATSATYDPPAGITATTYYRVLVSSLLNSVSCSATSNCVTVTVNPQQSAGSDGTLAACNTNSTVITMINYLTGAASGGTWTASASNPVGGTFNAGAGTFNTSGAPNGSYIFTYTIAAAGGCAADNATFTLTISNQNMAGTGGATAICAPASSIITLANLITGEDPGGTWTAHSSNPAGGSFNASTGTFNPSGAGLGTYFFDYGFNATAVCAGSFATVTVTINPQPVPILTNETVCPGATTMLTPGGFSSYAWSSGETTPTITKGVGTYTVTVTNGYGCSNTATSVISEFGATSISTTVMPETGAECFGETAILNATLSGSSSGCAIQWQIQRSGVWYDIPGATYTPYSATSIVGTVLFRARVTCGNGCIYYAAPMSFN